ncbi:hypothetical protein [Desulforegula conservatrix]|uniref:hypothetical protein n=1 Tax=Desulforegula conservatrix TaxID=153026 RepID=UPI000402299D|nr:hypothetical protein [Desulforegula conservatrix]
MNEMVLKQVSEDEAKEILTSYIPNLISTMNDKCDTVVRSMNLPFYNDFKLYEIIYLKPEYSSLYYFMARPGDSVLMDYTSESFDKVNALASMKLDRDTAVSYLKFFFRFVRDDIGRIHIIENYDDLPGIKDQDSIEPEFIDQEFLKPRIRTFDTNGLLEIACYAFSENKLMAINIMLATVDGIFTVPGKHEPVKAQAGSILMGKYYQIATFTEKGLHFSKNNISNDFNNEDSFDKFDCSPKFGLYEKTPLVDILDYRIPCPEDLSRLIDKNHGLIDSLGSVSPVLVQIADLPFYRDYKLCTSTDLGAQKPNVRIALFGPDGLIPLNYTNAMIYEINERAPLILSKKTLPVYLKFFFFAVRGLHGRFIFVEKEEDMPWTEEADTIQKEMVARELMPIDIKDIGADGFITATATLLFKNALFRTDIKIAPSRMIVNDEESGLTETFGLGQVMLVNENLLIEDLDVFVDDSLSYKREEEYC